MITKRPGRAGKVLVTFSMPASIWADIIYLVGDFNGWDERATLLRHTDAGWLATLELEPGQSYQYRYLVDGSQWHNDWHADGYAPNGHGGDNSVVTTPCFDETPLRQPKIIDMRRALARRDTARISG
jgi:1,4-alpha-glucan branching enzyme